MAFPTVAVASIWVGYDTAQEPNSRRTLHLGRPGEIVLWLFKRQKDAIERELGQSLEWEELPSRRDCRVSSYLNEVDPEDEADWPRQHEWLAKRLNDMHRVFAQRVRMLDAGA